MLNNVSKVRISTHPLASPLTRILDIVVVITKSNSLSRDGQATLCRTMEKYTSNMRIIPCANKASDCLDQKSFSCAWLPPV